MILCFYLLLQTVIDTYKSKKQLAIMRNVFVLLFLWLSMTIQAQEISSQDSLNIPVILVDGVEVQSLDSISPEDVVDIKVFKDEEVKKVFYPRVGGVVYITTKSKKLLTPVIQRYKENVEAIKKKVKEGQIYIR
jgi:aspartate carbamoyltransferase regulatory subunit